MKLTRGKKPEKEKRKPEPVWMQIEPARAGNYEMAAKKSKQEPQEDSGPEIPKKGKKAPKTRPKEEEGQDFQQPEEKPAAGSGPLESQVAELKERIDEIESVLEKMSERLKESSGQAGAESVSGDKMSDIEDILKVMKDRILSMNTRISDLEQTPQSQESQAPETGDMSGRLDTFDSRISGVTDKLVKLSDDMQKLTNYFMDGIKHVESRIMEIEAEKPSPPQEEEKPVTPSSFRSRIKRQFNQGGYPDRSQQESQEPRPPPAPVPERNVFTKLREGTVVRKPMPSRDPETHDLEVLMDHIRESIQKRESREKIRRDLINAGYDPNLIAKAFMMLRSG